MEQLIKQAIIITSKSKKWIKKTQVLKSVKYFESQLNLYLNYDVFESLDQKSILAHPSEMPNVKM